MTPNDILETIELCTMDKRCIIHGTGNTIQGSVREVVISGTFECGYTNYNGVEHDVCRKAGSTENWTMVIGKTESCNAVISIIKGIAEAASHRWNPRGDAFDEVQQSVTYDAVKSRLAKRGIQASDQEIHSAISAYV